MICANVQRRLNERPEHSLHDHLYPLVEALKAFHGAILQAALEWTPQMYHHVRLHCQTAICKGSLMQVSIRVLRLFEIPYTALCVQ